DGAAEAATMARKIAELRILDGETSVADTGAEGLLISQFTLYGDTRKGRRPSWSAAAPAPQAEPLVAKVAAALRGRGITVAAGRAHAGDGSAGPRGPRSPGGDGPVRGADAGGAGARRPVPRPRRYVADPRVTTTSAGSAPMAGGAEVIRRPGLPASSSNRAR